MSRRILVAEQSRHVVTAIRRDLEGTGIGVDAVAPPDAARRLDRDRHFAAIVRGNDAAPAVVAAIRALDPQLPVIALFFDEDEADAHPGAFGADGILVGPLTPAAVVGACQLAERLRAATRRVAEVEAERDAGPAAAPVERPRLPELELLKKLLLLEVKRSRRYGHPVSLAIVAVDRWPEIAARLGPAGAATLLAELLGVVTSLVRDIDLAVPFADDRFVILLPHTRPGGALLVADRICRKLRDHGGERVTASAGVAGHEGHGTVSFGGLFKRAGEALARARAAGGDRAEPADPPRDRHRFAIG